MNQVLNWSLRTDLRFRRLHKLYKWEHRSYVLAVGRQHNRIILTHIHCGFGVVVGPTTARIIRLNQLRRCNLVFRRLLPVSPLVSNSVHIRQRVEQKSKGGP